MFCYQWINQTYQTLALKLLHSRDGMKTKKKRKRAIMSCCMVLNGKKTVHNSQILYTMCRSVWSGQTKRNYFVSFWRMNRTNKMVDCCCLLNARCLSVGCWCFRFSFFLYLLIQINTKKNQRTTRIKTATLQLKNEPKIKFTCDCSAPSLLCHYRWSYVLFDKRCPAIHNKLLRPN